MSDQRTVACVEFRDLTTDYLERTLSPSMMLGIEQHRDSCEDCEAFLGQIRLTIEALGSLRRLRDLEKLPNGLLEAFRQWSLNSVQRGTLPADALVEELLDLNPSERQEAVRSVVEFGSPHVGERGIQQAMRMAVKEPEKALAYAGIAVGVFDYLASSTGVNQKKMRDRLSEAIAVRGNCRRICSDFLGAAEDFETAEQVLGTGTDDVGRKAGLLQLRAQFFADTGRLAEAIDDLDMAISVYRELGDQHNEGRTLIGKGRVLGYSGHVEDAAVCLEEGLELIDQDLDLRLVLVAKHNLVEYLSDSESEGRVQDLLKEARELHERLSNTVDLIRFRWLEGIIAMDRGDLEVAESNFLDVRRYFEQHEMSHDVAMVSLYLAMVYLKQARTAELKKLAGEMVTIFRGLGVGREVVAALAFFNKAREIEQTATVSMVRELIQILEKTRQQGGSRPHLSMGNTF